MTISVEQFRADFPAFANNDTSPEAYPDEAVLMYAKIAPLFLDATRWGDAYTIGQELFIAHNLVLDGMGNVEGARTGLVGFAKGPVSSEGGDKVSVSYDTAAAMEKDAGHWNLTTYGLRFRQLSRMFGAGAVQVGPNPYGGSFPFSGAWPGVSPGPW